MINVAINITSPCFPRSTYMGVWVEVRAGGAWGNNSMLLRKRWSVGTYFCSFIILPFQV